MTDHHWIILVLQGFLGMTEERAICYQLVRLRHCAKKVAALKQWTCLKLEVKKAAVRWSFSESSVKTETKFIMGDSSNGTGLQQQLQQRERSQTFVLGREKTRSLGRETCRGSNPRPPTKKFIAGSSRGRAR